MTIRIEQALHEIRAKELGLEEHMLSGRALHVEPGVLVAGRRRLRLTGNGLHHLCNFLKAPSPYLRGLDERVQAVVLQHHIDRGDLRAGPLVVFSRSDLLVGIGRADLVRLRGTEVLRAVEAAIGEESQKLAVHDLHFADEWFEADLISDRVSTEVVPGDVVRAGIRITHSNIGEHATWIEGYFLRLTCANGMTHRDCVARRAARTRRLPVGHPDAKRLQVVQVQRLAADTWRTLSDKLTVKTPKIRTLFRQG